MFLLRNPYPTATAIFEEYFTVDDGAAWPTVNWTPSTSGGGFGDIQNNEGRMYNENLSGSRYRVIAVMPTAFNTRVSFKFR